MTAVLAKAGTPGAGLEERKEAGWRKRDRWSGLVFVSPQLIGMSVFVLLPFAVGLVLAFAQWDGLTELSWVGLANFQAQLADPVFLRSILNTLGLAMITVPVGLALSLLIAVALDRLRGRTGYLLLYFAPVMTSSIAVSLVWQQILRADGPLNEAFSTVFGIPGPGWLSDPRFVLLAVSIVTIWSSLGLNVIIFLAGLQGINPTILEAARVDGAGPLRTMLAIRLPLLSPVVFFSTVVAVISSFQTFDVVFILTKDGGPENSARTIVYQIYDEGFKHFQFGMASAASIILLILTLVVTAVQLGLQRRFVHYES
ncbi:carbohydrate ABC transporter permease [Arthrobacter sp. H14-L1]|uniref:carbohydrate ABC transporter permease n=1 Tax=Arthrobacter sp. H14-L1 TaxID=2996697 RepID=UPI002271665C|nr:sugar ABC transporter permease [Arthrobacter sp. H14-L1]MCY0903320.1 sugar ABC transporter permease [Arthrobacter sp. H14-L1]